MSDLFFIISSICVITITVLLSILILKSIDTVDGVNEIVETSKEATNSAAKAMSTIASYSAVFSPIWGIIKNIFPKAEKSRR